MIEFFIVWLIKIKTFRPLSSLIFRRVTADMSSIFSTCAWLGSNQGPCFFDVGKYLILNYFCIVGEVKPQNRHQAFLWTS